MSNDSLSDMEKDSLVYHSVFDIMITLTNSDVGADILSKDLSTSSHSHTHDTGATSSSTGISDVSNHSTHTLVDLVRERSIRAKLAHKLQASTVAVVTATHEQVATDACPETETDQIDDGHSSSSLAEKKVPDTDDKSVSFIFSDHFQTID